MNQRVIAAIGAVGFLCASGAAAWAQGAAGDRVREPIVGGPCEGCEAVFEGMPENLGWHARIAPEGEPGEPMRIEGVVYGRDGQPAGGVIVYAYHTDADGIYPRPEHPAGTASGRHGRLRGWAQTDARGRYRFDTIRSAGYPGRDIPAHVHMHVIEVGRCTYYIDSIHFRDDPRLSSAQRARMESGRGGGGLVSPRRDDSGTWWVTRDIRLGDGTPACPAVGEGSRRNR